MLTERQILALYDILQLHAQVKGVDTPLAVQEWLDKLVASANGNSFKK